MSRNTLVLVLLLGKARSRNGHDCASDQLSIDYSMTKTNTTFILAAKNALKRILVCDKLSHFEQ